MKIFNKLIFPKDKRTKQLRVLLTRMKMLKYIWLLRQLVKHTALQLPCHLFASLEIHIGDFRNKGEFRAKKKKNTDRRTANTFQLVVFIKEFFSGQFFF